MASVTPQSPAAGGETPEWWKHPFRIFQTNIREVESGMDVAASCRTSSTSAATPGCSTRRHRLPLPLQARPQHPSPWLKDRPSGDLLGDAMEEAHKHGVRVIARCDFSKLHRDQFERTPTGSTSPPRASGRSTTASARPAPRPLLPGEEPGSDRRDPGRLRRGRLLLQLVQHVAAGLLRDLPRHLPVPNCKRGFAASPGGMALPKEETYADPAYPVWRRYTPELLDEIAGRVRA